MAIWSPNPLTSFFAMADVMYIWKDEHNAQPHRKEIGQETPAFGGSPRSQRPVAASPVAPEVSQTTRNCSDFG